MTNKFTDNGYPPYLSKLLTTQQDVAATAKEKTLLDGVQLAPKSDDFDEKKPAVWRLPDESDSTMDLREKVNRMVAGCGAPEKLDTMEQLLLENDGWGGSMKRCEKSGPTLSELHLVEGIACEDQAGQVPSQCARPMVDEVRALGMALARRRRLAH